MGAVPDEEFSRLALAPLGDWEPNAGFTAEGDIPPMTPMGVTPALATVRLDGVEMRSIEWLDRPYLQRSAFHLVAGPKGVGKGTWLARVTANMTRGLYGDAQSVLLVSTEDSAAIDIRPRLVAAQGDDARVHLVTSPFTLPRDLDRLRDVAIDIGDVGLICVDPIGNHLGGIDTDKEGLIRHAIHGLNQLADELTCTIIGIRHLTKKRINGALASVLGSTAWTDLPRAVLVFAPDDEDDLIFHIQVVAGNRSGRTAAQAYRIELRDVGLHEPVTYAVELGDSVKNVDQLLTTTSIPKGAKRSSVKDIILRELAEGPKPLDQLKARAVAEADASGETTWRAANELKADGQIDRRNSGTGSPWLWYLVDEVRTEDSTEGKP